jgi:hypothetical protein
MGAEAKPICDAKASPGFAVDVDCLEYVWDLV